MQSFHVARNFRGSSRPARRPTCTFRHADLHGITVPSRDREKPLGLALSWKLCITWKFRTRERCFISARCKVSTLCGISTLTAGSRSGRRASAGTRPPWAPSGLARDRDALGLAAPARLLAVIRRVTLAGVDDAACAPQALGLAVTARLLAVIRGGGGGRRGCSG